MYSQVSRKDEKYDPFNWNTIGSLILMCGGGLVIKLAGAGVVTLETAIGIMAGGGAAVGGGTELASQVQSGGAINPGAIATRTAFGGVKGALWGLAPELGSVGFGASIGAYSAVENLTYNAAKGKTTASDSIEAIAGGLGEGLFAGVMHKASSKAASKASESAPAKPEPIRPMTEAELEKVSGGAKDPGWKPGAGGAGSAAKAAENINKVRVGRWMCREEYEKMIKTGYVQESTSSTTHVANPASIGAFGKQAKPGSLYVEFDVPYESLKATSKGWAKILGPNTPESRLRILKGLESYKMPRAINIKVVGSK